MTVKKTYEDDLYSASSLSSFIQAGSDAALSWIIIEPIERLYAPVRANKF